MSSVRRRRFVAAAFAAVAVLALSACGFGEQTNQQYQAAIGANHRGPIDVLNTLLVANDDGSATLAAVVVNHTGTAQSLSTVTVTTLDDKPLPVRSTKILLPLPKDGSANIGVASDAGGFRVTQGAKPGYYVKITLSFTDAMPVTIEAPVVARTPAYDSVTGNGDPAAAQHPVKITDAKVVLTGDSRAYFEGTVVSTIDDSAYVLPTAVDSKGHAVKYRHQTGTGGPFGLIASADKPIHFGGSRSSGDADYFNAADLKVGETLTVTIPFQSGDVIVKVPVVAG